MLDCNDPNANWFDSIVNGESRGRKQGRSRSTPALAQILRVKYGVE
ncbi:hypothetical protein FTUN_5493 [Frigoriglobus tundricola]|uniref:Uncharacterized protein n=1 Tax=Frigoriglobus tundricola TaxID=2774151 RepID=A0A6M5YXI0_9BACT|nr:hypothetical protein FTUN_5493 [Frigoriglobus tundricola]